MKPFSLRPALRKGAAWGFPLIGCLFGALYGPGFSLIDLANWALAGAWIGLLFECWGWTKKITATRPAFAPLLRGSGIRLLVFGMFTILGVALVRADFRNTSAAYKNETRVVVMLLAGVILGTVGAIGWYVADRIVNRYSRAKPALLHLLLVVLLSGLVLMVGLTLGTRVFRAWEKAATEPHSPGGQATHKPPSNYALPDRHEFARLLSVAATEPFAACQCSGGAPGGGVFDAPDILGGLCVCD
jgi:hypothetical protein